MRAKTIISLNVFKKTESEKQLAMLACITSNCALFLYLARVTSNFSTSTSSTGSSPHDIHPLDSKQSEI